MHQQVSTHSSKLAKLFKSFHVSDYENFIDLIQEQSRVGMLTTPNQTSVLIEVYLHTTNHDNPANHNISKVWYICYSTITEKAKKSSKIGSGPTNFDICLCLVFSCYDHSPISGRDSGH